MERNRNETEASVVRNHFFGYLLGVFLRYSSYSAILNLQSSINIEDGLGTVSLSASYISCNIFLVFFTTILLRKFGAKKCLIASEVTYIIYILANLYPEFYTLIPAAILVGAGEATIWSSMTLINFYFATKYATLKKHEYKENDFFVNLYSGYFFTCIQFCQIFGNLVVYAVLYAFSDSKANTTQNTENNFTTTQSYSDADKMMFCGSNDCQDSTAIDESLRQYVPTRNVSSIILITILLFMCSTSMICHWYFISEDVTVVIISKVTGNEISETTENYVNLAFEVQADEIHKDSSEPKDSDVDIDNNKKRSNVPESNSNSCAKDTNKEEIFLEETEETFGGAYLKSLKDLGKHTIKATQLLLIPITLYLGLLEVYVFSELTRAFSSCVVGVEMVGIHMATYGFSDAVLSYVVGKVRMKIGRIPFIVFSMVVDFGSYAYCLWWDPNLESAWSIFIIYFAFGVTDGIWQTLTNVLYLEYFEGNHDVAVTSWVLWSTLGYALQYGWSTKLCVYVKIYIQVGTLILGMICYGVAEYLHRNMKSTEVAEKETRL
ncbi:protein unc-93 homolog A-like [Styela clava]